VTVDQVQGIRDLAAPVAAAAGLAVWDVEVGPGMVRVLLERAQPGAGVDLDTLAAVTRSLSDALDAHDDVVPAGRYHLEVSSPGLERRLRVADHYRRSLGSRVSVKFKPGGEPWPGCPRRVAATLTAADDDGVALALDGATGEPVAVPYEMIERARTILEWGPAPKPGSPKTSGKSPKRRSPALAGSSQAAPSTTAAFDAKDAT
jgi:ribosome maturation factor RimP